MARVRGLWRVCPGLGIEVVVAGREPGIHRHGNTSRRFGAHGVAGCGADEDREEVLDQAEPFGRAAEGGRDDQDGGCGMDEGEVKGFDCGKGGFAELAGAKEDEAVGGRVEDLGLEGVGGEAEKGLRPGGNREAWRGRGEGGAGAARTAERTQVCKGNDHGSTGFRDSGVSGVCSLTCGRGGGGFVPGSF